MKEYKTRASKFPPHRERRNSSLYPITLEISKRRHDSFGQAYERPQTMRKKIVYWR